MKLKMNPILEDLWRVKDDLAREAGHDIQRICENTRRWAAAHPHAGPVAKNATELRALLAKKEAEESLVLREKPPEYGTKKD